MVNSKLTNSKLVNPKSDRQRDGAPLTDKLLLAITRHLNQDHLEDILACAKTVPPTDRAMDWAEQASITQLDATGMTLEVTGHDQTQSLRIDFLEPARGVLSLRRLLAELITESRAQLGWSAAIDDS